MKLSLTNINLADLKICNGLVELLSLKPYLQYVDLSSCHLGPEHLSIILKQLIQMTRQLRDINISYNNLNFSTEGSPDYEHSEQVLAHLDTIFQHGLILNHFNASGMNLTQEKVKKLC